MNMKLSDYLEVKRETQRRLYDIEAALADPSLNERIKETLRTSYCNVENTIRTPEYEDTNRVLTGLSAKTDVIVMFEFHDRGGVFQRTYERLYINLSEVSRFPHDPNCNKVAFGKYGSCPGKIVLEEEQKHFKSVGIVHYRLEFNSDILKTIYDVGIYNQIVNQWILDVKITRIVIKFYQPDTINQQVNLKQ